MRFNTIHQVRELLDLAREIQRTEHIGLRKAMHKAMRLLASLEQDARSDVKFVPARVVMFAPDGQPMRVTGGHHA